MTVQNYSLHKTGETMEAATVHQLTHDHNTQERRTMVTVHIHSDLDPDLPHSTLSEITLSAVSFYWRI